MPDHTLSSGPAAAAAVARAAARARVALSAAQSADAAAGLRADLDALARALGGIRPDATSAAVGVGAGGMPLRADAGPAYAAARPIARVAPATRDGYVLVPRLAVPPGAEPARGGGTERPPARDVVGDDAFTAELAAGA